LTPRPHEAFVASPIHESDLVVCHGSCPARTTKDPSGWRTLPATAEELERFVAEASAPPRAQWLAWREAWWAWSRITGAGAEAALAAGLACWNPPGTPIRPVIERDLGRHRRTGRLVASAGVAGPDGGQRGSRGRVIRCDDAHWACAPCQGLQPDPAASSTTPRSSGFPPHAAMP
jgi:hypothetical protein